MVFDRLQLWYIVSAYVYVGTAAYYLLIHSALHRQVLAVEYFCMSIYYLLLEDSLFVRFFGGRMVSVEVTKKLYD